MDFTIITPNLNYGRFLEDCLSSVAAQEGVRLEHLVMDGGPSDESAQIASRFDHVTWVQEPDRGMSHAINKGFERPQGEWVMWLNADDRLKPGVLRELLKRCQSSSADLVYVDFDFIDADGRFLKSLRMPPWSAFVHIHHHCFIPPPILSTQPAKNYQVPIPRASRAWSILRQSLE